MSLHLITTKVTGNTLTMQTWGATFWIMEMSSSGDVTSIETHRFVFLEVMIERRRLARGLWVCEARDSYELIEDCQRLGEVEILEARALLQNSGSSKRGCFGGH